LRLAASIPNRLEGRGRLADASGGSSQPASCSTRVQPGDRPKPVVSSRAAELRVRAHSCRDGIVHAYLGRHVRDTTIRYALPGPNCHKHRRLMVVGPEPAAKIHGRLRANTSREARRMHRGDGAAGSGAPWRRTQERAHATRGRSTTGIETTKPWMCSRVFERWAPSTVVRTTTNLAGAQQHDHVRSDMDPNLVQVPLALAPPACCR